MNDLDTQCFGMSNTYRRRRPRFNPRLVNISSSDSSHTDISDNNEQMSDISFENAGPRPENLSDFEVPYGQGISKVPS